MRITAKIDYAVRAALELAAAGGPLPRTHIAEAQDIPADFLNNILGEMRHARLLRSQPGPGGGYRLAKPAEEISVADVMRAVEGPLAEIHGDSPEHVHYTGAAEALEDVWIAVRASLRDVVEHVSIADVAAGELPSRILALVEDPDAWVTR